MFSLLLSGVVKLILILKHFTAESEVKEFIINTDFFHFYYAVKLRITDT